MSKEFHTSSVKQAQRADTIIPPLGQEVERGEAIELVEDPLFSDRSQSKAEAREQWLKELAFNEEWLTIRIEPNNHSDFPEQSVPVYVNGRPSEVKIDGKAVPIGWLPIGHEIEVKRKYVEVLMRTKQDLVRTEHEDATQERPQNRISRRTSSQYPLSIIHDPNPEGRRWASKIAAGY